MTGRSESILATLRELVRDGRLQSIGASYASAGYRHIKQWRMLENRCCRQGSRSAIGPDGMAVDLADCPGRLVGGSARQGCWSDHWAAAGRPMPISAWEAAGRPDRKSWAAAGGRFSYDALDRWYYADATCERASGGRGCRRKRCYDCNPAPDDWRYESADSVATTARMASDG